MDTLYTIVDSIANTIEGVAVWIYDAVVAALLWVWDLICDIMYSIGTGIFDLLPDVDMLGFLDESTIETVNTQLYLFNCFLPIEESFSAISYFITAVSAYIVVKLLIKLIPTIG